MKLLLAFVMPLIALGSACAEDTVTGIALDFEPGATQSGAAAAPEGGRSAAFDRALTLATNFEATRFEALVTEVKLLPDKDPAAEEQNTKFKAKGDFHVDVLSPTNSIIPTIPLPADTYKKVEFKFDKPKAGTGLDGTDAVIALDATIGGVAVALRVGALDKVTLRHESGIALANGGTSTFLLLLDVPSWFTGVDLGTLTVGNDNVVHIDSKTNKGAYDTVTANIVTAIKLARKP